MNSEDKVKATARLLTAAVTGQDRESTLEQIEATREQMQREGVLRRLMPPETLRDDDPFLKACQEITGDRPVVRPVFPPIAGTTLMSVDYAGIEIDAQRMGLVPFSLYHTLDKLCVICRRALVGTGYRNTERGPAHVACLEPEKPKEPYVPPEIEG